jgi:hypothetical protein
MYSKQERYLSADACHNKTGYTKDTIGVCSAVLFVFEGIWIEKQTGVFHTFCFIISNGRIFHLRFIILICLRANMSTVLPHVWSVLVVLGNGRTSNGPDRAGQTAFIPPQSCVDFRHSRNFWIDTFGWMLYEQMREKAFSSPELYNERDYTARKNW